MSMLSHRRVTLFLSLCLWGTLIFAATAQGAPSANLDQIRNGSAAQPIDPPNWVNGNAGAQNAHYLEAMSIPYRVTMTELPAGTPVSITLGYDTKRSGKHGIDYLTHYQRLEPHNLAFGHSAETVDPLLGISGVSATISTFVVPAPSSVNSPVAGMPTTSYSALPEAERKMTLFGGTITNVVYESQGSLSQASAETRVKVTFTADGATAVLAWGGHIASRRDWGFDADGNALSAGGISGSSYHTRLISWSLGSLGSQDRSLSADAVVIPPPQCTLDAASTALCAGGSVKVCVTVAEGVAPFTYDWTGPNGFTAKDSCIEITDAQVLDAGSYTVVVTDSRKAASSGCEFVLTVNAPPVCRIDGIDVICAGGETTFSAPAGMIAYAWTGPGGFSSTEPSITIGTDGEYAVTITDANGCQSTCSRTLTVNPNPTCLIEGDDAVCAGKTAEFHGPAGMKSYVWTGPNGFSASTESITVGTAGEYVLTIVDDNGCDSTCMKPLTVYELPACPVTGENVICEGDTTTFSAPAAMQSYLWTGPDGFSAQTKSITIGKAGEYTVAIVDGNGCTNSGSRTLTVNPLPVCEIRNVPPLLVGPDGMKSYAWILPDQTTVTTQSITIPVSGWYELTVTNDNDCQSTCRTFIEGPTECHVTPEWTEVCDGESAVFTVSSKGGTAPFHYAWTGPNGFSSDQQIIMVNTAGTYAATVTDANNLSISGCAGVLVINPNPVPEIVLPAEPMMCYASGNALSAIVADGTAPFMYEWSVDCPEWTIDAGQGTEMITYTAGSGTATFTLKVTDGKGCYGITQVSLTCPPLPPLGEFCSLTQGAYGNAGGKWNGLTTLELIQNLLSYGQMVVGRSGTSVGFLTVAAQCIIDRLPAGGPADTLPKALGDAILSGPPDCQTRKPLPVFKNSGKFRNILLGQVLTLSLNVRLDPSLGTFMLAEEFCTQAASPGDDGIRGTGDDVLDPGPDGVYGCKDGVNDDPIERITLPASVLVALDSLGLPRTVNGLLDLANAALAGWDTGGAKLSEISQAVGAINDGFDECRFLVQCPNG